MPKKLVVMTNPSIKSRKKAREEPNNTEEENISGTQYSPTPTSIPSYEYGLMKNSHTKCKKSNPQQIFGKEDEVNMGE